VSDNNREAKFYRLTKAGQRQLQRETEQWSRMSAAVARVLSA
jgi:DNA-binding PadR family transcriptional regulator